MNLEFGTNMIMPVHSGNSEENVLNKKFWEELIPYFP
jgi:hypothetical protein